ncbi:ABC transporter substrate-binding protein [Deinococcus multiflagellatus]|uniref:ABC transporter substrate-binding protein n=1 Tax=Deinococcus multiflagellatus TaxID=1656887 RepID=A0ABW1ZJH2_9DEIO|nr:ABC transporter substrate-binding protein [Deinococcus multiflagellatus]MBZ9713238.1 ABC transporter substrate-binding protein [Deinococcus multiflagellatus]
MKRSSLGALALATLALTLAACNNKGGTASTGKQDTLVVQQSSDVPTLDPGATYDTGSGQIVENLYETLLTYKGSSLDELEPLLATEWTEGKGGREYRFTLREGVKFHTGNPMTCADAEYTFRRNLVTNHADSGNWFIAESLLGTGANANDDKTITWQRITDAVKCDGQTLVFTLPKPDPAFLAKLAYVGQSIVDSKHAAEIGEWDGTEATWKKAVGTDLTNSPLSQKPSGTGAYRLVEKSATSVTATAFDDYWGEKPKIKNVLISRADELAPRIQAFLKGDADLIETGGRAVIKAQLEGKDGVVVLDDLPDTTASALSLNQNIKGKAIGSGKLDGQGIPANFFSDVDVRRGFVAAFDIPTYIEEVQTGKGEPRNFLLPETFPGYDPSVEAAKFDPEIAKAAFQRAWGGQVWDKGFAVNISYRAGSVPAQTAMEILKKNIEALNPKFKVNIVAKAWSDLLKAGNAGTEPMITTSWAPDYADPDNFVHTFYSSEGYYNPRIGAGDQQIDAWINEARSTTDTARRDELYSQIARRAQELALYIILPSNPGFVVHRDNLQGVSEATYNPMTSFTTGTLWRKLSKS